MTATGILTAPCFTPLQRAEGRFAVRFMTFLLFSLIYLQKFGLFTASFPLNIAMLVMLASVWTATAFGYLRISLNRLALYLVFVGSCLISQSLAAEGSFPSLMQVILLYTCMLVFVTVSPEEYRQIMDRFVKMLVLPAIIVIVQYTYQKATGHSNPISMNQMLPKSVLMQGFYYEDYYPWYSTFMRPNGFFFLEPSFASAFLASGAIIEITYFRRLGYFVLLSAATVLSLGATGMSMLVIAAPLLLSRESPWVTVLVVTMALIGLVVALLMDLPLPLVSRLSELGDSSSSGGGRMLLPAMMLIERLSDISYFVIGDGAGSIDRRMLAWPLLKVLTEYGLVAMASFTALYVISVWGADNFALKVSLSVVYLFTGGYLLDPVMLEILVLLLFILKMDTRKNDPGEECTTAIRYGPSAGTRLVPALPSVVADRQFRRH
ncbi:MAG: hypothetical protein AB7F35_20775 [Acetobacteraceae bacterium]